MLPFLMFPRVTVITMAFLMTTSLCADEAGCCCARSTLAAKTKLNTDDTLHTVVLRNIQCSLPATGTTCDCRRAFPKGQCTKHAPSLKSGLLHKQRGQLT